MTFVILCVFAVAIGSLTVHRLRSDFNRQVEQTARQLSAQLNIYIDPLTGSIAGIQPPLDDFAWRARALRDQALHHRRPPPLCAVPREGPGTGRPEAKARTRSRGYRVDSQPAIVRVRGTGGQLGSVIVQYARPLSDLQPTIARVELFLLLGVIAGTGFALLAGVMIARRAMAPIAALTRTAQRDRAHARPLAAACPSRSPTTRSPSSRARSRACSASSTRRAARPSRCSPASGSSSPTPRTSCARR